MRIFDTHVHTGNAKLRIGDVLKDMDANGITRMALIAPHSMKRDWYDIRRKTKPKDLQSLLREIIAEEGDTCNRYVANLAKKSKGRIVALARADQLSPDAPAMLERAIDMGCTGLKLFQFGHYPEDERCFPTYEKCRKLGVNILFHTGILGDGRNSRFHRPANFEILKNWPSVRCLMAHISWPWTDECIATVGMCVHFDRKAKSQLVVDITPGAPPPWREDAVMKAWWYLGDEAIVFGSDARSGRLEYAKAVFESYRRIFRKHRVPEAAQEKIFYANTMKFWGLKD